MRSVRAGRGACLLFASGLALALLVPISSAASAPLLTSSVVATGAKQAVENGVPGVAVNYTNGLSGANDFCFYFTLLNTAGETIQTPSTQCISGFSSPTIDQFYPLNGLGAGSYKANLFVTTGSGVPVSTETSVSVSIK